MKKKKSQSWIILDDEYYTLKETIFCHENANAPIAQYRRNAVLARIAAFFEADRQALINYLSGKEQSCPQIDVQAAQNFVPPAPAKGSSTTVTSSKRSNKNAPESTVNASSIISK